MVKINWTEKASDNLKEIFDYISMDSKYYAGKHVKILKSKVHILKEFPKAGRIIPEKNDENFREIIYGNYRIMYKIVSPKRVDILLVFHSKRDFQSEDLK
jgi:toxin ParE1/3/4